MFSDTHCHIYKEYYEDIEKVIFNAKNAGINKMINNGCDTKTNIEVLNTIKTYDEVYGAIGIHPEFVDNYNLEDLEFIEKNIMQDKVIAVGEIGLDYHYTKENKEKQIDLFHKQLELAEKYSKPVVIHSREATDDVLRILKQYKLKGVIHSFSGSLETAKEYIKLGYLIGINGVVTFKNCKLRDILTNISLDNIILETDAPYLTPDPFRGTKNEPAKIQVIAEYVANLYNVSLEELSKITNDNINRVFDI